MDRHLQQARRQFAAGELEPRALFVAARRAGLSPREAASEIGPIEDVPGTLYSSNNSGGSWWLSEQSWHDLEAAGWVVLWKDGVGAVATYAVAPFMSEEEAIESFESVTGEDTDEPGCPCCGQPHYFSEN